MDEEKDLGGGKTPPQKPKGNGRGARSAAESARGQRRPVSKADLDIPGPGEEGIEKLTRPRKTKAPPVDEAPQMPAAGGEEEPTLRFRKGSVEVKGPKPPKGTAKKTAGKTAQTGTAGTAQVAEQMAKPKPRASQSRGVAPKTEDGAQPQKTPPKTAERAPAQRGARATSPQSRKTAPKAPEGRPAEQGRPAAGRPQSAGAAGAAPRPSQGTPRPAGESQAAGRAQPARQAGPQQRQGAPLQRGGGRPGPESRGSQPGSVRGRPAGSPPPKGPRPPRPPREEEPEEKRPYTRKELLLRRGYLALTILSAIIVVMYAGFRIFAAPPDVKPPTITRPPVVITTTDPEGNLVDIVPPDNISNDRKQEFYTFLVVGESQQEGGGLTDTMLMASYDVPNQKLSVMSLPRDIYVMYNGRRMLLNAVYTTAGSGDKGIEALCQEVQELTGVYPDYSIRLKWEAVGELVDAIGGVWFDVPRNMHYWDPTQNLRINVDKGYQLLDGEAAMGVVRFRATYADGDLGRIKTQQAFLKALISQCLEMDNLLKNLGSYVDIFQRNVTTNLTIPNLTYFASNALTGLDMENVSMMTLPNRPPYAGCDHLVGIPREIVVMVNQYFNPYKVDIHLGELNVLTDVPAPTPAPTPTPEESEEPDPEESEDPEESPDPSENPGEGTILPPGVTPSPKPSVRPTPKPGESQEPDPTPKPTPTPAVTPEPTQEPDPVLTPPPVPTPTEDEPLLPPGI